jgi:type IV pilus assembly protein PilM
MSAKSIRQVNLKLACEITADRVIAGRTSDHGNALETCSIRTLSPGAVAPSLTAANVINRAAVANAVSDALSGISTRHHRDVIAIIPDAACRIALLDFDAMPEKPQDADSVVRFRLKKSLPFEVERAKVSYDVRRSNGLIRVVAAVALPIVLDEYESVMREAGFSPGVVVPSTLAALGLVEASRPALLVKVAHGTISVAIVHEDDLLLFRVIESGSIEPAQLADDIYPSLVFLQDTYNVKVERILLSGTEHVPELASFLEKNVGIRTEELVTPSMLGSVSIPGQQRSMLAGIAGALIS